jgi:limonene-1,2-epoxide hydrolase
MSIERVAEVYQQLTKDNLHLLETIYHPQVVFEDAAHKLEGWPALDEYFHSLYTNVTDCRFDIHETQQAGDSGFLTWVMRLQHPRLNKGSAILVHGTSHIRFKHGKIVYHRDYFDLGEMLYEHLPVLGAVIKTVKARLGQ